MYGPLNVKCQIKEILYYKILPYYVYMQRMPVQGLEFRLHLSPRIN
jgi:hypothetical protein